MATVSLKMTYLLQHSKKHSHHDQNYKFLSFPTEKRSIVSTKSMFRPMDVSLPISSAMGVSETFTRLKQQGKVALIPYITAGDPDLRTTAEAMKVLDSCGSDIIELGIPYSDPFLDGPVLQASAERSLAGGTSLDRVVSMLKGVIPQISCPVVLLSYYNQINKLGIDKFMSAIKDIAHGLLVPDVLLEESDLLRKAAVRNNIELVLLTTPTTTTEKMKAIVEASEGFVYLVSLTGVTGCRPNVSLQVQPLLQEIKKATTKPVVVGFGLSTPEHLKQVARWGADGAIVGSAIMKLLGEAKTPEEGLQQIEIFTKSLKAALP